MQEEKPSTFNSNLKWLASVAVFVVGVVGPYYDIKTQMALIQQDQSTIKSNHLQHLQDIAQDIKDIKEEQSGQQKQIIELQKQILVLINNRNGQ